MKDLCCVGKRSQRTRGAVRSTWNLRQFWPHIKLTAFTVLFSKASAQLKGFPLRSEVCVSEFRTCRKSIKWEEAWIFVTNQLDGSLPPHARKRNYVLSWKHVVFLSVLSRWMMWSDFFFFSSSALFCGGSAIGEQIVSATLWFHFSFWWHLLPLHSLSRLSPWCWPQCVDGCAPYSHASRVLAACVLSWWDRVCFGRACCLLCC